MSAYPYRYLQKKLNKKNPFYNAGHNQPCCNNTNTVPIAHSYIMVGIGLYRFAHI